MKKKNLIGKMLVLSTMMLGIVSCSCSNPSSNNGSSSEPGEEVHEHNLSKVNGQSATCSREGTEDYKR